MRILAFIIAVTLPLPSLGSDFVATRNLPAGTVLTMEDMQPANETVTADPSRLIGLETRVAIYEGRPFLENLLRAPTLVERNQIVRLQYRRAGVYIATDGRALENGQADDVIRVLNQASHTTVTARVAADGTLHVSR